MAKNILLVSKNSKEETELAAILAEINFGVFVETDPTVMGTLFSERSIQMVILFERAAKEQVSRIEEVLEEARRKRIPILWIATPTFAQEHDFLKKDQILLWPMDIDLVIDAIETSIGLPLPPEERTIKVDASALRVLSEKVGPKTEAPTAKVTPVDPQEAQRNATLLRDIQALREELKKTKDELRRERELLDHVRGGLQKLMEAVKR